MKEKFNNTYIRKDTDVIKNAKLVNERNKKIFN